ncbi:hypothetical protein AX16_010087 [Volvariella volvacea WC 439]|nr:hypothetical protein AX16_010087 [Volvariella volvacea WC 439]
MSNIETALTQEELDRSLQDLGGERKYQEFLAAPAPSLDLFNPDSLSQTTGVHGTISLSLTGPAAIARLTAHTEDGHHGSGLNFSGSKDPNVIDYEGTLYYDSWEDLESAPNDVELQAGGSILIRFTVVERLGFGGLGDCAKSCLTRLVCLAVWYGALEIYIYVVFDGLSSVKGNVRVSVIKVTPHWQAERKKTKRVQKAPVWGNFIATEREY